MKDLSGRNGLDPVLYWNSTLLNTFREVGGAPGPLARTGAMMHAAQWDALVSVARRGSPYRSQTPALADDLDPPALEAALHYAAYEVLKGVHGDRGYGTELDAAFALFDPLHTPTQIIRGVRIGAAAAEAVLEARSGDEHYEDRPGPGDRQPEVPAVAATPEQTRIGYFWANDLDGTYKPPGQLFDAAARLSREAGLGLEQNVRLFGLLGLALADAAIAARDSKHLTGIGLRRPEQAIGDGEPFTPPSPDHVSGHAVLAGAWAAVMRLFFGADDIPFTVGTEDPRAEPGETRDFASFTAAAEENARSRVYLGVQHRFDGGNELGTRVGEHVFANYLRT